MKLKVTECYFILFKIKKKIHFITKNIKNTSFSYKT